MIPQPDSQFDFVDSGPSLQLPEITLPALDNQWLDFLRTMCNSQPHTVTPAPYLGMFEMSVRRLCDLGYMQNPKRFPHKGKLTWSASWVSPYSLSFFLDSPKTQYQAFARSMSEYAQSKTLEPLVGYRVEKRDVTLSGILAVAHRAGETACLSWFMNSKDRMKFVHTTQAFVRANGIF